MDSLKLIASVTEQTLTNKRMERQTHKQMKRGLGRQTLYMRTNKLKEGLMNRPTEWEL